MDIKTQICNKKWPPIEIILIAYCLLRAETGHVKINSRRDTEWRSVGRQKANSKKKKQEKLDRVLLQR
jgi:hypothetical protein